MAGYNEPQLFRAKEVGNFVTFVSKLLEDPFEAHVEAEARRLRPIFESASKSLSPLAVSKAEASSLTPYGIERVFTGTALSYGALMLGMPLILEEGFAGMQPKSMGFSYDKLTNPLKEGVSSAYIRSANYLEPGGGTSETNRMFGVGRFGFISIQYRQGDDEPPKGIAFPYITAPKDFLRYDGARDILLSGARLNGWVNHDWFHNVTAACINPDITMAYSNNRSPARQVLGDNARIRKIYSKNGFRDQGKIGFKGFTGNRDLESWAMRAQKEMMSPMLRTADNPVSHEIDRLVDIFRDCGMAEQKDLLDGFGKTFITPSEYAARIPASVLVRMTSRGHHVTKSAIRKLRNVFAQETAPTVNNDPQKIFDKTYEGPWAKKVIFGPGHYDKTPDRYKKRVLNMTAHAIHLAALDNKQISRCAVLDF